MVLEKNVVRILIQLIESLLKNVGLNKTLEYITDVTPDNSSTSVKNDYIYTYLAEIIKNIESMDTEPRCLARSCTVYLLAGYYGINCELVIGIPIVYSNFQAHAWIEYNGIVICEKESPYINHKVIYRLKEGKQINDRKTG